jgi:hypothetical protein
MKVNGRFRGTYHLHLQGCGVSQARSQHEAVRNQNLLTSCCFVLVSWLACTSVLKMEVICFSKTSVDFQQTTWCYITEGSSPGQVMWDLWWTKWHWRQVFSEYFGFHYQFAFHRLLYIYHHLSTGAGTIGQLVADVPSGLSLTPPQETKKKTVSLNTELFIVITIRTLNLQVKYSRIQMDRQVRNSGTLLRCTFQPRPNSLTHCISHVEMQKEEKRANISS